MSAADPLIDALADAVLERLRERADSDADVKAVLAKAGFEIDGAVVASAPPVSIGERPRSKGRGRK